MLSGIVGELDDQQLFSLHAAADAVGSTDLRTLGGRFLQDAEHLLVSVINELKNRRLNAVWQTRESDFMSG